MTNRPCVEKKPAAAEPGPAGALFPPLFPPALALAWSESQANREDEARPLLALWTPAGVTAAIGLAQDPERELDVRALRREGAGLVRRASGGGAVILARGVLCWESVAPPAWLAARGGSGIREAYAALSAPVTGALRRLGLEVVSAGISDLSLPGEAPGEPLRKLAGTAQLRRKNRILVHGALLLDLDLRLLYRFLRQPVDQPEYRAGRTHGDFCLNAADRLGLAGEARQAFPGILAREIAALARDAGWEAGCPPEDSPSPEALRLAREKYLSDAWNWRRRPGSAPRPLRDRPVQPGSPD